MHDVNKCSSSFFVHLAKRFPSFHFSKVTSFVLHKIIKKNFLRFIHKRLSICILIIIIHELNYKDHTDQSIENLDARLNLTDAESTASLTQHLPLGVPKLNSEVHACILTQNDYVTGHSHTHRMPLWSAFTVNKVVGFSNVNM